MRNIFLLIISCTIASCGNDKPSPYISTEIITSVAVQEQLFQDLQEVFLKDISGINPGDSLSFLILPLQASCPSCRKKTIDSIMAHPQLQKNHFINIAISGGRKTANSFFRQQNYEMPELTSTFQFDSTNLTYQKGLYKDQPMIYYAANQKVYKKIAARPSSVREDLREFFTGYRKKSKEKEEKE